MQKRMPFLLVFFIFSLLLFTACKPAEPPASSEAGSEIQQAEANFLDDVDVRTLLTVEQVADALGKPMGEAQVYENGTRLYFLSEDSTASMDINFLKTSREIFEDTLARYSDLQEAPNIGETAKWSEESGELLLYGKGMMISLHPDAPKMDTEGKLTAARHLAALILEKLPTP